MIYSVIAQVVGYVVIFGFGVLALVLLLDGPRRVRR
jgi:hypothetical protein